MQRLLGYTIFLIYMILINLFEQGLEHIWPDISTTRNTGSHMFETLLERSIKIIYTIKFFKINKYKGKKFKIQIQNSNLKFENLNFEFYYSFLKRKALNELNQ